MKKFLTDILTDDLAQMTDEELLAYVLCLSLTKNAYISLVIWPRFFFGRLTNKFAIKIMINFDLPMKNRASFELSKNARTSLRPW